MLEIEYVKCFEQGKLQSFSRISLNHKPKPVIQFESEILSRHKLSLANPSTHFLLLAEVAWTGTMYPEGPIWFISLAVYPVEKQNASVAPKIHKFRHSLKPHTWKYSEQLVVMKICWKVKYLARQYEEYYVERLCSIL